MDVSLTTAANVASLGRLGYTWATRPAAPASAAAVRYSFGGAKGPANRLVSSVEEIFHEAELAYQTEESQLVLQRLAEDGVKVRLNPNLTSWGRYIPDGANGLPLIEILPQSLENAVSTLIHEGQHHVQYKNLFGDSAMAVGSIGQDNALVDEVTARIVGDTFAWVNRGNPYYANTRGAERLDVATWAGPRYYVQRVMRDYNNQPSVDGIQIAIEVVANILRTVGYPGV